jgi:hypothetical protein
MNNSYNTQRENFDIESYFSAFIGFLFAFTNHFFGWVSNPLSITDWNIYLQAVIAGILGALMSIMVSTFMEKKGKKFW